MILNADDFMFEIADGFAQNPKNIALRNKHFQTNINDNTTIIPLYPQTSMKSPLFKFVHRTTPPVTVFWVASRNRGRCSSEVDPHRKGGSCSAISQDPLVVSGVGLEDKRDPRGAWCYVPRGTCTLDMAMGGAKCWELVCLVHFV